MALDVKSTTASSKWGTGDFYAPEKIHPYGQTWCSAVNSFSNTLPKNGVGEWIKVLLNKEVWMVAFSITPYGGYNIGRWKLEGLYGTTWKTLFEAKKDLIGASENTGTKKFWINRIFFFFNFHFEEYIFSR